MRLDKVAKDYPEIAKVLEKTQAEGIGKLYPPQAEVIKKGLLKGGNMVISIPTASGKTLLAELALMKHVLEGKKGLYLVPLRALASEKFQDFTEKYGGMCKVGISTGDYDSKDAKLRDYDIIILTFEKMDSLLRHGVEWLGNVGAVVFDEVHLLDSINRGPTLEMVIVKLRRLVKCQIIALSATIQNSEELGAWLDARVIESDFRPVKLWRGIYFDGEISFEGKKQELAGAGDASVLLAKDTVKKGAQSLVFVNTRRSAEAEAEKQGHGIRGVLSPVERDGLGKIADNILKAFDPPTAQCRRLADVVRNGTAFHHAGLGSKQRELVEQGFKDNLIKIISATPTLAMGVNLPGKRVVVRDWKRYGGYGMEPLPVLEMNQMFGRCVCGDTIIFSEDGPKPISEIASAYFSSEESGSKNIVEPLKILSVDIGQHTLVFSPVKQIHKRKTTKTIELETRSGKLLRLTETHPVLTFNKNKCGKPSVASRDNLALYAAVMALRKKYGWGPHKIATKLDTERINTIQHWLYEGSKPYRNSLNWKPVTELTKGAGYSTTDYVCSTFGFDFQVSAPPPDSFLPADQLVYKGKNRYMNKGGHQTNSFPSEWSKDLCRFIAKIMADGNIYFTKTDNSYEIRYFNKNRAVQQEYARICKRLFEKKVSITYRRGTYQARFKSFSVGQFLVNIGVPHGKKSLILRMPKVVYLLSDNLIKDFIREYCDCDGWETPVTYSIISCSKELIYDFALLFQKIGMVPRIFKKKPNKLRKRFAWIISVTKSQFDVGKKLTHLGSLAPDMVKKISLVEKEEYAYDFTLEGNHNFVANGLVVHNSGRPKYDKEGEAVLIAKSFPEYEQLWEHYTEGQNEPISSKLGLEPTLRTHVLGLLAQEHMTKEELYSLFECTFYSFQYGSGFKLEGIINNVLDSLFEWGLIIEDGLKFFPTKLGQRIAELYIDPLTAHELLEFFRHGLKEDMVLLTVLTDSGEMRPLAGVRQSEEALLYSEFEKYGLEEEQLRAFKMALILSGWMDEKTEDRLFLEYGMAPGIFRNKLAIADWLLYACREICIITGEREAAKRCASLRKRMKYGVREELLPLVRLKNIGRVRARRLYNSGIQDVRALKNADPEKIAQILGRGIAKKLESQLVMNSQQEPRGI